MTGMIGILAQATQTMHGNIAALGAGLAAIGAGIGIGQIGGKAVEAIEGVALFAVVVAMIG